MSDKFKNVPVEAETKIKSRKEITMGAYEVRYEKWFWDGICAESIIFDAKDVSEISDEEILNEVRNSSLVDEGTKMTLSRTDSGFVFVNFNFNSNY